MRITTEIVHRQQTVDPWALSACVGLLQATDAETHDYEFELVVFRGIVRFRLAGHSLMAMREEASRD